MTTTLEYTRLLYDALHSPLGIVVETDDAERLRQKLYAIRRTNEDLAPLAFLISPANGVDLWIMNKGTPDAQEP